MMNVIRASSMLLLALLAGACNLAAAAEELETQQAMEVAREWLDLVDGARFGDAWDGAGAIFRGAVEREKWEIAATQARGAAGGLISRKLRTAAFTRKLANAPDGDYVVIHYDTRFERQGLASETLTTGREKDGRWRVVGYWIR
jgi:hypothetical protein